MAKDRRTPRDDISSSFGGPPSWRDSSSFILHAQPCPLLLATRRVCFLPALAILNPPDVSDICGWTMIGKEDTFGASQALDGKVLLSHDVIQIAAAISVISSDRLREVADEMPAFRGLLIKCEQSFWRTCNRLRHATPCATSRH